MLFDKSIIVSGVAVKLRPYTEKRLKDLIAVNEEIQKFVDENPNVLIADIKDKRAEWYKRKADILWEGTSQVLDVEFFKSAEFESSLLKESEDFFLKNAMYL
jgi:hypothetical protein